MIFDTVASAATHVLRLTPDLPSGHITRGSNVAVFRPT